MDDTVLVQATTVSMGGRALLIEGKPGSGKSSLALSLIEDGACLIGDDGTSLSLENGIVRASPPPNITGKIEIRHVGIATMPTTTAPLALIISLIPDAPRLIETPENREVLSCPIPVISLPQHDPTLPQRARWAMKLHGMRFD